MTTPILSIPELTDGMVAQFAVANQAIRSLEAASNDYLACDLTSADKTLTSTEFTAAGIFLVSGNSVSRTLTVPQSKRLFLVRNAGSATLNVTRGSTTVTIATTKTRWLYTDGTTNGLLLLDLS